MPASVLSSHARAALRARAHDLKPLLHVGKEGITPALIHAVSEALRTRDLVKLKVLETAPDDVRGIADSLATDMEDLHVVQVLGRVATLHRPLPVRAAPPRPTKPPDEKSESPKPKKSPKPRKAGKA